jgi:hypothetical protein
MKYQPSRPAVGEHVSAFFAAEALKDEETDIDVTRKPVDQEDKTNEVQPDSKQNAFRAQM